MKELEQLKEKFANDKGAMKRLLVIETEFKRYSTIEQFLIKRGFDDIEDFIKQLDEYVQISEKEHEKLMMLESPSYQTLKREYDFGVEHYNELLNEYNKEHKALEIIKTVCPNVFWVMRTCTYEEYKKKCPDDTLLQEEYDLLKEELL